MSRRRVDYQSRKDDTALRERLKALSAERRRIGYRRLAIMLRREGQDFSPETMKNIPYSGTRNAEIIKRMYVGFIFDLFRGKPSNNSINPSTLRVVTTVGNAVAEEEYLAHLGQLIA